MKTILLILVSMAFIHSAKAEDLFPYQVYLINDKTRSLTVILAIDSSYQLKYFVMKSPDIDDWLTYRENKFESGDNVSYFSKERCSFAINLDTFTIDVSTTNVGYSMAIKRKGQLVPFDEMRHTILEYPNKMGVMASFLCKDISVLPQTTKEAVGFGPEKIKELISQNKVFLKTKQQVINEVPLQVP